MKTFVVVTVLALAVVACDDTTTTAIPPDLSAISMRDLSMVVTGDAATTASVDLMDNFYAPISVTIARGGTVTWTWRGVNMHTVTNNPGVQEIFDSSPAKSSGTFMHTFNTAGSFGYHCEIHGIAVMHGTVVVQ